jgi:putative transposase
MARLPRLAIARCAHLVLLRGHSGQPVFRDELDRRQFLLDLHAAFTRERVALHGYALPGDRVWLLCTPAEQHSLSRAMQALGRAFAAGFNRRHGRSGALWDGRFRATVVERGSTMLDAMVFVDQACHRTDTSDAANAALWSSARQHLGFDGEVPLNDASEYWGLGNTPFDRAAAYAKLFAEPQSEQQAQQLQSAAEKGWAIGSASFLSSLRDLTQRPVAPRARGRPRKHQTPRA